MKRRRKKESSVCRPGRQPQTIDEIKKKVEGRPDEAYLTTGEVSRLLDGVISRSTVTRLFDRGSFEGRVNPITGKRQIKWRAVEKWLEQKGYTAEKIAVIEKRHGEGWTGLRRKNKSKSICTLADQQVIS